MGRVDWKNIKVIEEWAVTDPTDHEAVELQRFRMRLLSGLILKAFLRHKRDVALKERKRVRMLDRKYELEGVQTLT